MSEVNRDDVIETMARRIVDLENKNALLREGHAVLRDRLQEISRQCIEVLTITREVTDDPSPTDRH